ncbi:hypothetical protein POM88_027972 [Heracleum sosnowskyi]|uniref:TMV resistance protein N n=1 Tax=Heracleum sosnowskyi TaxID=360622 RepID=A0AAD8MRJ5_9APIA|nr:hypothetical protein POM88_027972 [Heracleum sosnowskyi]
MAKIKRWRTALTQVANLGGMPLQNVANGYESKLIQKIVNVVKDKVTCNILSMTRHPVGIGPSVQDITLRLRNGSTNVEVFALYGIGGVGKTTIAKCVYNMNFQLFEGISFLENIREYSKRSDGLVSLQRQLLSDICKGKTPTIKNLNDGILKIKSVLRHRKLLIVLDDMDQAEQLDSIFGMREWFHQGSKIIITTRNLHLLNAYEHCTSYAIKTLNSSDSLELFSQHAFQGQRSRLWHCKDSLKVLNDETGSGAIEGLSLEMNTSAYQANLRTKAFSMMHKLRLLKLNNVRLSGGYKEFPKNFKLLCWHNCPLRCLPNDFPWSSLVAIDMQSSKLQKLGNGNIFLGSLKFLNLSHCYDIVKTPDFSKLYALEQLLLEDCASLVQIDESIGMAEGLVLINLKDCKLLEELPENICMLKLLETLIISGYSNLGTLPKEMRKMESLKVFHADGLDFGNSNSTTHQNKSWREFIWGLVSKLRTSPQFSFSYLPCNSITSLSLVNCNLHDNSFSKDFRFAPSLDYLDLSMNPISFLPDCFKGLKEVKLLRLHYCNQLLRHEDLPNIEFLKTTECPLLEKITLKPGLCFERFAFPYKCDKLLEMDSIFKVVPVEKIDPELISNCGISDVESMKRIQIRLCTDYTAAEKKCSIQGVFENQRRGGNLFSIFYPGSSVPTWFTSQSYVPSLSFVVSHSNLRYLNTCVVYKVKPLKPHQGRYFYLIFHNMTSNKMFVYHPACHGIPEDDEYMTWLSPRVLIVNLTDVWKAGVHLAKINVKKSNKHVRKNLCMPSPWKCSNAHHGTSLATMLYSETFHYEENKSKRLVLPIFYHVDPSDVRKQSGWISEALCYHEEKFKSEVDETKRKNLMDKIKEWRIALTQLANLGGMPLQNVANGYESKLIQKIVNVVKDKVTCTTASTTHPVGIGPSVQDISLWLRNGSSDVEVFALYGVGGLGKTTIAKYVYDMNFQLFEGGSFLENIREYYERSDGLVCLQRQLLSDISKGKAPTIKNLNEGILKIKKALHRRKLLIVLDDVDQVEQLDAIFGMREWFHQGSKIIITTRNSMGREIIRQQSPRDPGQRSRLWHYKDSLQVLRDETGTKAIEGLTLEMNTTNENMLLGSLKFLNLSHCHGIVKSLDFAKLSALEHLVLEDCACLVEIDESIGMAEGLVLINLKDCILLKKLPENFCTLKVLETLIISGCSNLSMLPAEMRTMESLKVFHADGLDFGDSNCTAHQNKSWREFIWGLVSVPKVSPQLSLASLPCNSITTLSLANCNLHDNSFPVDFRVAHSLEFLNLSNNPIRFLPDCFKGLKEVKIFRLHNCNQLQTLEDLPFILDFRTTDCPLLEKITFKPGLSLNAFAFPDNCENLLEMVGVFKIVPIENMDSELINRCGISDVEPMKSIQIRLYNRYTSAETKCSIQGVFENRRGRGRVLSRVNMTANKMTNNKMFVYQPACYGIPEGGEYMTWLSHWKIGSHDMGPGDEVNISIFNHHDDQNFEVKEIGVYLVYEEQEQAGVHLGKHQKIQQPCDKMSHCVVPVKAQPGAYHGSLAVQTPQIEIVGWTYLGKYTGCQFGRHAVAKRGKWVIPSRLDFVFCFYSLPYLCSYMPFKSMGRDFTRQQSPGDPGQRSRLWHCKDSLEVLSDETGSVAIKGLALEMNTSAYQAELRTKAFSMMHKLRLLKLNNVRLRGGYKDFPKNLSHCHDIVKTPNFAKFPALEQLLLEDCASLVEIDESIGMAEGLVLINLKDCILLKKLPENFGMLKLLHSLIISGCSNLTMLPAEMRKMESLKVFHANGLDFGKNSSGDFRFAPSLEYLNLSNNPIGFLPDCFKGLKYVKWLTFIDCNQLLRLEDLPNIELLGTLLCPILEKITLKPGLYINGFVFPQKCEKLLEMDGVFKIVPIGEIDSGLINNCGISDVESMKTTHTRFYNGFTFVETKCSIQGFYENQGECNLFSIFILGVVFQRGSLVKVTCLHYPLSYHILIFDT